MEPDTRTGRLAQQFRLRAADVRSQLLQRHGLPDDAPLAAAFVAPLRSCCPPQEGLREVAREEAEYARQRHAPPPPQPQPQPQPARGTPHVSTPQGVDASLGTPARIAVGVAVTGVPGVPGAAPGAPVVGAPLSIPAQPLPRVATTDTGHALALPAAPRLPPVNTGGEEGKGDRRGGQAAQLAVAPGHAGGGVPDTPQTPQTPFMSDSETPVGGGGGGAGVEAAPEVDASLAEARAAEAERQATHARASAASALALKAASKILADRRKPRQAGTA